ncbi:fatty acid desaturase [Phormidium sp. CLA17]|uniref:fatty acid desaturase family protein n=1 Tax=Leptolyngbya sp. Cla-17 TaxID=2803751 RepID=UPI0014913400|nr:fatty acid desaturase [Leptolyngbya sp. Cla-17]MBM0743517.1 fatty acid desaturase [Leptolyngbya sp. Cla-17]
MSSINQEAWMTQADYAKKLRPLLPPEAFISNPDKVWILLINLAILFAGWAIADHLDHWQWYFLWLYLPLALVMGNSVIVLLFSTHDVMHNRTISNLWLRRVISILGLTLLWMPPTLWKAVHNREHHGKTNSVQDPDRNYLHSQPNTWGKWIQNAFVPSAEVNPILLTIGMGHAWGIHTFRNLTSVLLFNDGETKYPVVAFTVSGKERRAIALEFLGILGLHIGLLAYLEFNPVKLLLSYFLPIWIGYAGVMFYIYTNHMACRMTSLNDVLVNSLSIRVPKVFDLLHLNFSYHTEHHIFPGLSSDYYPMVQALLQTHYPERFNLLDAGKAWQIMLQTPRHYKGENIFTDWSGDKSVVCPISRDDRFAEDAKLEVAAS